MIERSPKCVHQGPNNVRFRRWPSPTLVIGACVEGIGDQERHPVMPRTHEDKLGIARGGRLKGFGNKYDCSEFEKACPEPRFYPLLNGADFRQMDAGRFIALVGFHLHNFFDSSSKLRFKHKYYGHVHDKAFDIPLDAINADLNILVKCMHNMSDVGNRKRRVENGLKVLEDELALPVAF